jgi:hypothetical protein
MLSINFSKKLKKTLTTALLHKTDIFTKLTPVEKSFRAVSGGQQDGDGDGVCERDLADPLRPHLQAARNNRVGVEPPYRDPDASNDASNLAFHFEKKIENKFVKQKMSKERLKNFLFLF